MGPTSRATSERSPTRWWRAGRRSARPTAWITPEMERDGWAVVPLLDERAVTALGRVVDDLGLGVDHGFFASVAHGWGATAAQLSERLCAILSGPVSAALPDHEVAFAAVTSKGAGDDTAVKFHLDWTYTDERSARAVLLWCPLVDAGPHNGGLEVVPGSHRWTSGIRAARPMDRPPLTEKDQVRIAARRLPLTVPSGQAVLFDPSLLHGSGANLSDRVRPAVTAVAVPRGAALVHFHEEGDRVRGATVEPSFFVQHPYGCAPIGYPELEPWAPIVTEADIERALDDRRSDTEPPTSRRV